MYVQSRNNVLFSDSDCDLTTNERAVSGGANIVSRLRMNWYGYHQTVNEGGLRAADRRRTAERIHTHPCMHARGLRMETSES